MNLGGWYTALRISVRELRRAKGRGALVLATIALPVLALSFAAVTYDTFRLTPAEQLDRRLGGNDAELRWLQSGPIQQDPVGRAWITTTGQNEPGDDGRPPSTGQVADLLPPGSRIATIKLPAWVPLRAPDGVAELETRQIDLTNPLTRHLANLLTGRAPTGPTEVAVTERTLRRLGVTIGEPITPLDGSPDRTVVGVVELPDNLGELIVVPPAAGPPPVDNWLIKVPGGITGDLVLRLNQEGVLVTARSVRDASALGGVLGDGPDMAEPYDRNAVLPADSVAVLVGGLGLLEVVLLAGPALAVGARRRRRDLALVAANGGTPAHLRRIVLADGVLLGGCGALVGLVLGVTAAIAGRPLAEQFLFQSRAEATRIYPTALIAIAGLAVVTGVLAALVPAHVAARQDVVASLTGRRGRVRSRRHWLGIGLVGTTAGTALAAYGATRVAADIILAGLILAEIGLVACTPSLIGLLARIGPRLPLAPRIALRDTARNRSSAAPAISAVMAAVAGTVALGAYETSSAARQFIEAHPTVPPDYVLVRHDRGLVRATPPLPSDRVAAIAKTHFTFTGLAELRTPGCPESAQPVEHCGLSVRLPPARECPYQAGHLTERDQRRALADPRCARWDRVYYGSPPIDLLVDDGSGLPILADAPPDELARAITVLHDGGVVVINDPLLVIDEMVIVDAYRSVAYGPAEEPTTVTLPGFALASRADPPLKIISPAALARLDLVAEQAGFLLATPSPPDARQREDFRAELRVLAPWVTVEVGGAQRSDPDPFLLLLAGAAGLITLGAAGMATGLAAAEGRADLSTLGAIGASPWVRRALSLSQAGVIAGLGALLGVAAGLSAAFAILTALNQNHRQTWPVEQPYPIVIPWAVLGVLLVVPVVAMLGAGLLTSSRLPVERRIG